MNSSLGVTSNFILFFIPSLFHNLIEAMRWSTVTPSIEAQPLAESASRLDEFLTAWVVQLSPRKETQEPGKGWDSGHFRGRAAPDIPVVKEHVSAKSQLYVLERLLFAIICLTNRFYEAVLPARLVESELTQRAQSEGAVRLLERELSSLEYLDKTAYWKARRFEETYQNLWTCWPMANASWTF